jgi:hypothetical protein
MNAMRKTIVTTVLGLAAVAAIGISGTSLGAASHPRAAPVKRIHLLEREAQVTFLDRGPKGLSAGDERLVTSTILTPARKAIGQAVFVCTITGAGKGTYSGACHGSLILPGGQIAGEFGFTQDTDSAPAVRQAITGGTGAYRGARGQLVVQQVDASLTPFVVELVNG